MEVVTKIKRLRNDVEIPKYATDKSAGFDLAVADDVVIPPGKTAMATTGLVIQAPPNHMLLIAPRSSTWKKYNIRLGNTVGIVDEDYCGPLDELFLSLFNAGSFVAHIDAGTRLAQGIMVPVTRVAFEESEMAFASRGGWGSSG